jgi:hypothetical protein
MHPTSVKPQAEDAGRDARGRFAKGNKGGPGNPYNRRLAELRRTLFNFETQDDMRHVACVLKELALGGDLAAIKLLFQYVLGKPKQTVDPERLDVDECQKTQENTRPPEAAAKGIDWPPTQTVETVTKAAWPCAVAPPLQPSLPEWRKPDARDVGRRGQTVEKRPSPKRRNGTRPKAELIANGVNGPGP